MEFEVSYDLESAEQFWAELDDIVQTHCDSHEAIDNALRAYLHFTTKYKDEYLQSDFDVAQCTYKLLESTLFQAQKDYVRRQIVYGLLQEDDRPTLHLMAAILLHDGRNNDMTFEMMQTECAFPRLIELLQGISREDDFSLHGMLMGLLYEMSRVQRLTAEDMQSVGDHFILHLYQLIEVLSDDVDDPYHYPVIRVLLVLNEQYMVISATGTPLTNRVLKVLSTHGNDYKTFGENLILLLNRESEISLQLLILKLLYLLFSSSSTAEYFYTNDLHVLLDVILRNLLDLPGPLEEGGQTSEALRHTYLRVLYPLLANSQLKRPNMGYKRDEIRKVLRILGHDQNPQQHRGNGNSSGDRNLADSHSSGLFAHFAPIDATTLRLVKRCANVEWLRDHEASSPMPNSPMLIVTPATGFASPAGAEGRKDVARHSLGMSDVKGGESALSVIEMAKQKEKPGLMTPSRMRSGATGLGVDIGEASGETDASAAAAG